MGGEAPHGHLDIARGVGGSSPPPSLPILAAVGKKILPTVDVLISVQHELVLSEAWQASCHWPEKGGVDNQNPRGENQATVGGTFSPQQAE